ncbi:MAG: TlpA family protein disulfide reductase [Saprospiraceae bacterium]|nr:TlpA family protein disulfide reductase [Saprospiraceae bacterium]
MKKLLLLVCALIISLAFYPESDQVSVEISIEDPMELIEITCPIDGYILWNQRQDTLLANGNGTFKQTYPLAQASPFRIKIGKLRFRTLFEPGQHYNIKLEGQQLLFSGKNAAGLTLFSQLKRPGYTFTEDTKFAKDTTAAQITGKIGDLIQQEKEQFQQLHQQGSISKKFLQLASRDIDYYYAKKVLDIILSKAASKQPLDPSLVTLMDKTLEENPIKLSGFIPEDWDYYVDAAIIYKKTYELQQAGKISREELDELYETGELHHWRLSLINDQLSGQTKEQYLAFYLYDRAVQSRFEKSLVGIFTSFKQEFPESPFTPYIKPLIDKIITYHKRIESPLSDKVKILDGSTITDFDELREQLKGQAYYVDLWATWCSPCKREFKHNMAIDSLLKNAGYQKLYISIDKASAREKWIDNIKYFGLEGTHLLASKAFVEDFATHHSLQKEMMIIPQYLIVDPEGKVVSRDAPKPSQSDQLGAVLDSSRR